MKGMTRLTVLLAILTSTIGMTGASQAFAQDGAAADGEWSALRESMENMHVSMMSLQQSASGDADFVKLMLVHHQAAVDMAKAHLLYGQDPQLRRLAQEIIADQESEIAVMQLWLRQRRLSAGPAQESPGPRRSREP